MTSVEKEFTPQQPLPAPEVSSHARTLARLVRGKNINETTFLATDYLNHFNEIIMLIEMISEMPECLEDAHKWQPKTYVAHFQDSCFHDKELAVLAYQNAPERFRAPFDSTVEAMNDLVRDGLAEIESVLTAGDRERVALVVGTVAGQLRRFVDLASAIIHGQESTVDQARIDAMLDL